MIKERRLLTVERLADGLTIGQGDFYIESNLQIVMDPDRNKNGD